MEEFLNILAELYPHPQTELNYETPFELLVAVILSAQCTDKQVNKITAHLFAKYHTPEQIAALTPEELAEEIKGCGLYRNKSKNIVAASRLIMEQYQGKVPESREELEKLPGVGRKTANVMAIVAFGQPAMPVDTHVFRLAHRFGWSQGKNPLAVEKDLVALFPPEKLADLHHQLILHGRRVCKARKPLCAECKLNPVCPAAFKEEK